MRFDVGETTEELIEQSDEPFLPERFYVGCSCFLVEIDQEDFSTRG